MTDSALSLSLLCTNFFFVALGATDILYDSPIIFNIIQNIIFVSVYIFTCCVQHVVYIFFNSPLNCVFS